MLSIKKKAAMVIWEQWFIREGIQFPITCLKTYWTMWDDSPSTGTYCSILTDFCENCTIMAYNRIILYVKFYYLTSFSIFRHICPTKAMFLYCWELAFGWPFNKIIENSRWAANQICQILFVAKDQGVW